MKQLSLILFFLLCMASYENFAGSKLTLESDAFKNNTMIPADYTCYGKDQSPSLNWNDVPPKTQSLALVVEDPDAPNGPWTHWVLFNMSPKLTKLDAGSPVPEGAANGKNSWGGLGYRGPCPTMGAHRYIFKLYALDNTVSLGNGTSKDLLLQSITGHVLGSAELVGLYQKTN